MEPEHIGNVSCTDVQRGWCDVDEGQAQAYQAASMYYAQGDTMDNIARRLGVSRSTVSRMLKYARESGMVRITLVEPDAAAGSLAAALDEHFRVRAHIVDVKGGVAQLGRLERVARVAAGLLTEVIEDGNVVGVAWGTTTAAIANHLPRRAMTDVTVVQLNGAANPVTTGIPYAGGIMQQMARAWDARMQPFPVPAFFDDPETREMLWRERAVRRVREVQARADVAVFGVGSVRSSLPSHVYAAGYLDDDDFAEIERDRVVGDVCTVFLRQDGTWRDVALNARASGPTPDQLQGIGRRFCVVSGAEKVPALAAALRAGVATDLVVDGQTARELMAHVRS